MSPRRRPGTARAAHRAIGREAPAARPRRGASISAASLALAGGCFGWIVSGAVPSTAIRLVAEDRDKLRGLSPGLPPALLIAGVLAFAIVGLLGLAGDRGDRVRASLAAASLWLYSASLAAVLGPLAPALAAVGTIAAFVVIARGARPVEEGGILLALHACGFGSAICLFHQWAQYRDGWPAFLENARAMLSLLF